MPFSGAGMSPLGGGCVWGVGGPLDAGGVGRGGNLPHMAVDALVGVIPGCTIHVISGVGNGNGSASAARDLNWMCCRMHSHEPGPVSRSLVMSAPNALVLDVF